MDSTQRGGADWDADVQETMERARALEALETPPPRHTSRAKLLGLLMIPLLLVAAWNVWDVVGPPAPMEPSLQEANLAGILYVLSQQIDAHAAQNGAYPASLDEVGPPLEGVSYRLESEGYVLEAWADEVEVVYGSWEDAGVLLALSATSGREAP